MNDIVPLGNEAAEALMGQIIDEFLERQERGDRPDIEEYARRYPQLAAVLRQMLPTLGLLQASADGLDEAAVVAADISPEGPLGDYRLVREIGRGGMGVVYEAVQISLGRRVALKILPFAAALDTKQLQRFRNEAHAAAQLHHQNIVPVFGVGSDRGVHYYAMQFIDGQTLAAVISDLRQLVRGMQGEAPVSGSPQATGPYAAAEPSASREAPAKAAVNGHAHGEDATADTAGLAGAALSTENSTRNPAFYRSAAQLGIQAARALEHSHSLGVVHRDIKPTNLLVDARGNLWITDFGLAHVHNDTKLTLTGDIVGTLRYMSPEQALAQRVDVDHRTDIYSLGATLYELLTLEPTFTGQDRRELLRQIAFEEPRRPRQINKAIPLELETIVLKALEKNPAERYATAKEMADDLERFLTDEPIRARRPTLLLRARKWARRHRSVVVSAVVATAAVVAIAIGALAISLGNISAALAEKTNALDREKETTYLQRIALAGRELAAGNVGRAEELLDSCPEHLRGWEWHFLKRQRYGNPNPLAHQVTVSHVAFSPNGRQLATGCIDGTVTVWDARTGQALHTLRAESAITRDVAYSADSRYLAVAYQNGVVGVWHAAAGELLATLRGHHKQVWQVAFSPDGQTLASAGSDRSVRLWDLSAPVANNADRLIRVLADHPADVKGVAFSPDGGRLLTASSEGTVKTWNVATGREIASFRGQLRYDHSAHFNADARRLAWACQDGVVKVWDVATGREEFAQQSGTHVSRCVAFSPDGRRLAVAGFDGTVRLLDGATGGEMLTIYAHPSLVAGVAFSPDGQRLASASYDHTVRIWDATPVTDDNAAPHCVTLPGHRQAVYGVAFSRDGRWFGTASADGTANLWEILRKTDPGAAAAGGMAHRYTLRGHSGNVIAIAFSADRRTVATASWDNTVKLWDVQVPKGDSLTELRTITRTARPTSIAFSRDGALLAIGQVGGIAVFDPATGNQAQPFKATPAPVPEVAFGANGRLYSAGASDPVIKVWEVAAAKPVFEIRHYANPNATVAVSPDGRLIASPGRAHERHVVKIWDAQTHAELRTLKGHLGYVWKVAFSPDGRYLASGSWDSSIKVWDLKAPESAEPVTLRGHAGFIQGLAFSPDGRRLASASGSTRVGEVRVWDAVLWESVVRRQ